MSFKDIFKNSFLDGFTDGVDFKTVLICFVNFDNRKDLIENESTNELVC